MTTRRRRGARARLLLTLAALATLIGGYYLGQLWQRKPLQDLSAVVYAQARTLQYNDLAIATDTDEQGVWRLFVAADTRVDTCSRLLQHYAFVLNRLAHRADIQRRLRVTLLAYDNPDAEKTATFRSGIAWTEIVSAPRAQLDALAAQLGIQPLGDDWCSATSASAVLVSPAREAWALIPYEAPVIMADNIAAIVDFVE